MFKGSEPESEVGHGKGILRRKLFFPKYFHVIFCFSIIKSVFKFSFYLAINELKCPELSLFCLQQ